MGDLTVKEKGGLIDVLHGGGGLPEMKKPFEREIMLFDTYVAGTTHVTGIEDIEPLLKEGDKLNFFREPDNEDDKEAIMITTEDDVKIGYVPKKDNIVFARLIDAGKLLFGRIVEKEIRGRWVRIRINIFLHE